MLGLGNSLTGGVVIEEAWSPADLTNLLHWYKKGVGQTSTEGVSNLNCDLWTDQKGSKNLTGDGVDGATPTLNADGTITFDSGGDIMTFGGGGLDLGTFSIYVKVSYSDAINGDFLFEEGSSDFFQLANEALIKVKINSNGRHDYLIDPVLPEDGTPFNIGFERVNSAGRNVYVYSEGISQALTGGKDGIEAITELLEIATIGKPVQTSTYHEIVICSDALSTVDRALLNTYLDSI